MIKLSGPFGIAAGFVFISAMLHIFTFSVAGFGNAAMMLIPYGIAYLVIVAGLTRGMRWLAWIAFFVMAIGGILALAQLWTPSDLPVWWMGLIIAANWFAAAALFANLWRAPAAATASGSSVTGIPVSQDWVAASASIWARKQSRNVGDIETPTPNA